jgi:hypothetical protein
MAAVNNVTKDWNSVLSTAEAGFTAADKALERIEDQADALKQQEDIILRQILRGRDALDRAKNPADRATIQQLLDIENEKRNSLINQRAAVEKQRVQVLAERNAYKPQIDEAKRQLATQAKGTTPASNTTVAATVTPASAQPGNPNVATKPAPAPNTTPKPSANVTNTTNTTRPDPIAVTPDNFNPKALPDPDPAPNPILKTKPDPIAITADVDPISGRAEPIAVTNGDPSLTIIDEPLATPVFDEAQLAAIAAEGQASIEAALLEAEGEATAQDQAAFAAKEDWRVRLSLAPDSQYMYNAPEPGILKPLKPTDGVIFPYTPSISVNYAASYEQTSLVHSNYKIFQYSGSGVDSISIACAFTAQDDYEANYLLAVIHFFRSMTKMFYGQDDNPKNGTPPPLCYMFGMGGYQFAAHPLAIQGFSYTLPDDVDYIKTTSESPAGAPRPSTYTPSDGRLAGTGVEKGGKGPGPSFSTSPTTESVTWVPTRIQMTITCVPIMSRNAVSNRFSLRDYASGKLLNGTREPGGGMW